MYPPLNDAVWEANMPPTVKLVALCLSSYFNDADDAAYPSESTIAKRTGLSKRTVIRSVQWLVQNRMFRVKAVLRGKSVWPVNHYVFTDKLVSQCHLVSNCHHPSDTMPKTSDKVPQGGDTMPKCGDKVAHDSSMYSSKDSSKDSESPAIAEKRKGSKAVDLGHLAHVTIDFPMDQRPF